VRGVAGGGFGSRGGGLMNASGAECQGKGPMRVSMRVPAG